MDHLISSQEESLRTLVFDTLENEYRHLSCAPTVSIASDLHEFYQRFAKTSINDLLPHVRAWLKSKQV